MNTSLSSTGKLYLTVEEVADIARCSPATIRRAVKAKRLACVKPSGRMGRTLIRVAALDAYMQRGTQLAIGER